MNFSPINRKFGQACDWVAKNKLAKKLDQGLSDPVRFASAMLVTSIVSKDLVGCALYTSQSLNNKKIPEEKRGFVASLDLMNGIIMVGGQLFIGKVIDAKVTPKLLAKFTGTIEDPITKVSHTVDSKAILHPDNLKAMVNKVIAENKMSIPDANVGEIVEKISKISTVPFKKGFGILVAAVATTALTKRTLAPLLSTPLAGWFKENFMDKKAKPKKDRMYYEVANIATKYDNKMDKTAFSSVSSRQS